jgi:hypothetical protein
MRGSQTFCTALPRDGAGPRCVPNALRGSQQFRSQLETVAHRGPRGGGLEHVGPAIFLDALEDRQGIRSTLAPVRQIALEAPDEAAQFAGMSDVEDERQVFSLHARTRRQTQRRTRPTRSVSSHPRIMSVRDMAVSRQWLVLRKPHVHRLRPASV